MSGKGDDKRSKKEKDKTGSKLEPKLTKSSQESTKGEKSDHDSKSGRLSCAEEHPVGSSKSPQNKEELGQKTTESLSTKVEPPSKPKRRTKGKNTVAGELEKSLRQGSTATTTPNEASSLPTELAQSVDQSAPVLEPSITHATKPIEKRDRQKMAPSKPVDQSKNVDPTSKRVETLDTHVPSSIAERIEGKPSKVAKTRARAPPTPEFESSKIKAETSKTEESLPPNRKMEPKQPVSMVEPKPPIPKVEPKPVISKVEPKPPTAKVKHAQLPEKVESKPRTRDVETKPPIAKVETKPSIKAPTPPTAMVESKAPPIDINPTPLSEVETCKSADKMEYGLPISKVEHHTPSLLQEKNQPAIGKVGPVSIAKAQPQTPPAKAARPTVPSVRDESQQSSGGEMPKQTSATARSTLIEANPQPPLIQTKPQPPLIQTKPQQPLAETKPRPPLAETKPQPPLVETKPQPPLAETKPQPPLADTKPQPSLAEDKPFITTKSQSPEFEKPTLEPYLVKATTAAALAKVTNDGKILRRGDILATHAESIVHTALDQASKTKSNEKQPSPIPPDKSTSPLDKVLRIIEPSPDKNDQQPHRKLGGFLETSCQSDKSKTSIESQNMDDDCIATTVPSSEQTQVRVLTLNSGDNHQQTLYRLQTGFILQIRPGPSLFGKKTTVFTNCPSSGSESFERTKYRKLKWQSDSMNRGDDTSLFVEIHTRTAGSFHFYLTLGDCIEKEDAEASGYFLVDPILTRGLKNEILPLDCIQCDTFISKCIGTLDRWPKSLQVAKEAGYNMVHFTPIQELGSSRSAYSLQDQHKLNQNFSPAGKQFGIEDLKKIIDMMDKEWKMLSITDIVLNHTANESKWLVEHPESTYNLVNSPHLRPAYILDRAIYHFSMEIAEDKWASEGIPCQLVNEQQVQALKHILQDIVRKPKIEQYFLLDVDSLVDKFYSKLTGIRRPSLMATSLVGEDVEIIPDPLWRRFKSTVDIDLAMQIFNISWADCNEEDRISECCRQFRCHLEHLNETKAAEIHGHISCAVTCIIGAVRYERLQDDGPKICKVSSKHPLVPMYFTHPGKYASVAEEEEASFGLNANYIMAQNGWVLGGDPLKNFAGPGTNVYLRRELVAWGDCLKLRYGEKPEDSTYLWQHMRLYVEETARVFHGIRLDNCHSTPIHVAEYLLDCARKIRPNLYVIAELFTDSDRTDNVYVNRLGISSLVREAMSAPNSHEEGRLVYRYGGEPVGAFLLPPVRPLMPSIAHAIFFDLTHDNKSPCESRTAWDMLPSTALVNMACCASGSTRGYDEIVPHHINVVTETREYSTWADCGDGSNSMTGTVNSSSGILGAKKILNDLHYNLGANGFTQVFIDQVTEHIVAVTRHNPVTHESIVLVSYTSFRPPAHITSGHIRPLTVQGKVEEILFELKFCTKTKGEETRSVPGTAEKDTSCINGISGVYVEVRKSLQPKDSIFVKQISPEGANTSVFDYTADFTPGSVIAIKLSLLPSSKVAIGKIRSLLADFGYKQKISEIDNCNKELLKIVRELSLSDLNRILYRCEQEERDEGKGWGSYNVPNMGSFIYCGLQGIISIMGDVRVNNDLGHPICGNLRDGNWLMDYIIGRLKLEPSSLQLALWLEDKFNMLKQIPKYLIPAYFDAIITAVYLTLINHAWDSMSKFVSTGSGFAKALSLCSVQFCGVVKSSLLPRLSPNLAPTLPPKDVDCDRNPIETSITISAGLPHFSVGYMRNWGRDTFIALPGNLLVTGRFDEARWIILAFGATLRHGLIPNLLDGGSKARFNCRDAVWFWLYSIQRYVSLAPNGCDILKDKVSRIFPDDKSDALLPGVCDQPLENVIQEALQRHFEGLKFQERNAGLKIDSEMSCEGFMNEIGVDLDTGFPFGGNEHNCGTWMDKMGSSTKAGNKGKPATPRDGSAVEIVGLCKAAVKFLSRMHSEGKFSFEGVTRKDSEGNEINWSYKFWDYQIQQNFEKYFWISATPDLKNQKRPDLVNRRGIYKDTVGATQLWGDFQLRCNFPIALALAPEMISTENGKLALAQAEEFLLGPLGMKTLDPKDWAYRGDYDNSNDGTDATVAHGFNYHQGPEWLWPVGWFLKAKLAVASNSGSRDAVEEALSEIKSILAPRFTHLLSSPWRSLPELTNSEGAHCRDSNPAQAWSTGCLLEVLWEMHQVDEKLNLKT